MKIAVLAFGLALSLIGCSPDTTERDQRREIERVLINEYGAKAVSVGVHSDATNCPGVGHRLVTVYEFTMYRSSDGFTEGFICRRKIGKEYRWLPYAQVKNLRPGS